MTGPRLLALLGFTLAACTSAAGGGDGADTRDDGASDGEDASPQADVPPVDEGDWWRPSPDDRWQWQLTAEEGAALNLGYDVEIYDFDLFDVPDAVIEELHASDRKLLCYFSAGSYEQWRPDAGDFPDAALGKKLDGWAGERWLDVRHPAVFEIMTARLDRARERGCDGVEPDNVDGYTNGTGFDLTAEDQLAFNRQLANAAHDRGLAIALKNSGDQAAALEPYFDLELNEECHRYDECDQLAPFVAAGKPVLNAEYPDSDDLSGAEALAADICDDAVAAGLRTLVLPLDLDEAFRVSCDTP